MHALERLPPCDEGREHEIAERPVIEQERAQRVAVDRDIAERLRHERGQEDGLPREEVQLTEKTGGTVPNDLVAGRVKDRHLALADRDERIRGIPDPVQHVADARRALLTQVGKRRHLRGGQRRDGGNCHRVSVAMRCQPATSAARALAAMPAFVFARPSIPQPPSGDSVISSQVPLLVWPSSARQHTSV